AEALRKAVSSQGEGSRHAGTWSHQRKDGSTILVDVYSSPTDFEGTPARIAVLVDVTERTKSEGDRAQLAAIVASSDASIISFTTAGSILSWNKGAELQYGYSAGEVIGKSIDLLIPSEMLHERDSVLARLKSGTSIMSIEATRVRKGGARIEISGSLSPILNARGEVTGGATVSHDISARKNAEQHLRRSEANMATAQRIAHFGSWETDLSTMAVTWSEETYRIFGLASEIGMTHEMFLQLVHPDDRVKVKEAFAECSKGGKETCAIAHRLLLPDGQIKFVEERWQITCDVDGTPRCAIGTCHDVTEQQTAAAALRASDAKYRSIFDNASEGIFQNTPEGAFLSANPALARMLGFDSPEELIHVRHDLENQSYASPAKRKEFLERLEQKGAIKDFEYEVKRKDGSLICVSENVHIVRDEAGHPLYYEGTVLDITARKETAQALQKEREFLAAVVDNVSDGIVSCDANGVIALFNAATREFHGLPAEPIAPDEWAEHFDLYLPDGKTLMRKEQIPLFRALEQGFVEDAEMVIAPREGTPRRVLASGRAFFNEQGEKVGAVVAMHDVTERKQAERTMREQAEMLNLAQDAIAIRGYDDRVITYWNKGSERLYGWTAKEAIGQPIDFLYNGSGDNEAAKQTLEASGEFQGEVHQVAKDGRSLTVNVRANVMRNSDGTPRSVLSIATDITKHKKLESQFLRA
ncbi:MAG: PAS domain S-box protein, partial [Chthoniobacterales bacterium]|nr:PAS domain S-box protein [Chthoniobacterales bacterium]